MADDDGDGLARPSEAGKDDDRNSSNNGAVSVIMD